MRGRFFGSSSMAHLLASSFDDIELLAFAHVIFSAETPTLTKPAITIALISLAVFMTIPCLR